MTNYFGKQKLVRILYNYLELSAPEKLAELKRELKEAGEYRKYGILYRKYRGSEWLTTGIVFGHVEYQFEIYACGGGAKKVTLREKTIIDVAEVEKTTEIFSGYAYYDKDFNPITEIAEKYSDLLICNRLQKTARGNDGI